MISYSGATTGVRVDLAAGTATGEGNDTIVLSAHMQLDGSRHGDVLLGSNGNDFILGQAGDDRIEGRGGNDYLIGDPDIAVSGDTARDTVLGGDGNDEMYADRGTDTLDGQGGNDTVVGYAAPASSRLYGGDGNDSLTATLSGRAGQVVDGGAGSDSLTVYTGDSVKASQGPLVVDRRHGKIGLGTINLGTLAGVERYTMVAYDLRARFLGADTRDVVDAMGAGLSAWTYGGDDLVRGSATGADHIDMGTGTDTVYANSRSTCLNWEKGRC